MDTTRSRIILYILTGVAALIFQVLLSGDAKTDPLQLLSTACVLCAIALLARTALKQLDAADSLSAQQGEMIGHGDTRLLVVPVSGCPEMNAVGHQLNVLIYAMSESLGEARAFPTKPDDASREHIRHANQHIYLSAVSNAA